MRIGRVSYIRAFHLIEFALQWAASIRSYGKPPASMKHLRERLVSCSESWDHVPIRGWSLFKTDAFCVRCSQRHSKSGRIKSRNYSVNAYITTRVLTVSLHNDKEPD